MISKNLLKYFLLCASLIAPILSSAQEYPTLNDLLNNPECTRICWIGIEVGKTTEIELQEILDSHGLTYSASPLTEEANSYDVHMRDSKNIAIIAGDTVGFIAILFENTDVSDAIDIFGYPDRVIENQNRYLVYSNIGIVIVLYRSSDQVVTVQITTPKFVKSTYIDNLSSRFDVITKCSDSSQVCDVITQINQARFLSSIRDSILCIIKSLTDSNEN